MKLTYTIDEGFYCTLNEKERERVSHFRGYKGYIGECCPEEYIEIKANRLMHKAKAFCVLILFVVAILVGAYTDGVAFEKPHRTEMELPIDSVEYDAEFNRVYVTTEIDGLHQTFSFEPDTVRLSAPNGSLNDFKTYRVEWVK